jgi:hypothetical protein
MDGVPCQFAFPHVTGAQQHVNFCMKDQLSYQVCLCFPPTRCMQRAADEHAVHAYSSSNTIQDTVQHASVGTVQHVVTTQQRSPPTGLTPLLPTLLNETAQSGSPILPYPAISAQLVLAALDLGPAPCPHTHTNSVPCQYLLSLASQALTTRFYQVGAPLPGCGFTSACKHSMFVHLLIYLHGLGIT